MCNFEQKLIFIKLPPGLNTNIRFKCESYSMTQSCNYTRFKMNYLHLELSNMTHTYLQKSLSI